MPRQEAEKATTGLSGGGLSKQSEQLASKLNPSNSETWMAPQALSRAQCAERITTSWQRSIDAVIETGRHLITAKASLDHDTFTAMVESDLPFEMNTARRLMAVARDPRISNCAHGHLLPPHWRTLYELTKLDDTQFQKLIADGTIHAEMERADIETVVKQKRRAPPPPTSPPPSSPTPRPKATTPPSSFADKLWDQTIDPPSAITPQVQTERTEETPASSIDDFQPRQRTLISANPSMLAEYDKAHAALSLRILIALSRQVTDFANVSGMLDFEAKDIFTVIDRLADLKQAVAHSKRNKALRKH